MSERVRQLIIFGLLIITVSWAFFRFTGNRKQLADTAPQLMQNIDYSPDENRPITLPEIPEEIINEYRHKSWGPDPFYHDYKKGNAPSRNDRIRLHLLGIVYREINAQALINGHILKTGDIFQGFQVVEITRNSVILQHGNETVTLWVAEENSG